MFSAVTGRAVAVCSATCHLMSQCKPKDGKRVVGPAVTRCGSTDGPPPLRSLVGSPADVRDGPQLVRTITVSPHPTQSFKQALTSESDSLPVHCHPLQTPSSAFRFNV